MKKILLMLMFLKLYALDVAVTILPQKYIVNYIDKEANVYVMVPPGSSPATYAPSFKDLKHIKKSQVYFKIGVPFDKKYMQKIKEINQNIQIVDFGKYLKREKNPHIWLSPAFLMLEAKVVLDELIALNPSKKEKYLKNYKNLIEKLAELEKKGFLEIKQKSFITFHPSFYYFAKDFHIQQIAIEKEGKTPSFAYLNKILKYKVKTVIISPEFPKKYALIVARKLNAKVEVISPLKDPLTTIDKLIKALK